MIGSLAHPRTLAVCALAAPVVVDVPLRPPLEHLFQHDPGLHACQRRTEAEVQTLAEAQVAAACGGCRTARRSGNARSSRLADPLSSNMIDPRRSVSPEHSVSWATYRACTGDGASKRSTSSMAPGISDAVGNELAALIRVIGQQLAREADQPGGGLVAGAGDHAGVRQHLGARQLASRSTVVLHLGVEQLRSSGRRTGGRPASRCTRRTTVRLFERVVGDRELALLQVDGVVRWCRGSAAGPARGCRADNRSCASGSAHRGRR